MAGPTDALNVITPVVLTALGLVLPEIAKREQKNKFTCLTRYGKIPSLTVKFIKTPLKALFYLGFSAVPFRFTI